MTHHQLLWSHMNQLLWSNMHHLLWRNMPIGFYKRQMYVVLDISCELCSSAQFT